MFMQRLRRSSSNGFTIIEVLLVLAIIGLLLTLGLPAIQSARESARRAQCLDNMRQYGLAFAMFESQNAGFPSGVTLEIKGPLTGDSEWHVHNYMADLLPFLGAGGIDTQYHRDALYCAPQNHIAIGTALPVALCPSASHLDVLPENVFVPSLLVSKQVREAKPFASLWANLDKKYSAKFQGAVTDYSVPVEASAALAKQFGYAIPTNDLAGLGGMFPWPIDDTKTLYAKATLLLATSETVRFSRRIKASEVTDGMSNTFLLTEVAGRPERWQNGRHSGLGEPWQSAWSDPRTVLQIDGTDGPSGKCLLQCDNENEIYSFHPAGANFLFADGHVQTAPANTDPRIILEWLTPGHIDGN